MKNICFTMILAPFLILPLCCMLQLTGCYTYTPISRESIPDEMPPPENDIRISTMDGRTIDVQAYHFVAVQEPASFIYGIGESSPTPTGEFSAYCGKFEPIAHSTESARRSGGEYEPQDVFTLRDGSIVRMFGSDLVKVDSSAGPGLWCTGVEKSGQDTLFSGRVAFSRIRGIEIRSLSASRTIFASLGIGAAIVGMGYLLYAIVTVEPVWSR